MNLLLVLCVVGYGGLVGGQWHSDGTSGGDYSAIPGQPDVNYPILYETIRTSFKCEQQQYPGYYADVEARCQVFHICANNLTYDFLCPNGTIFHQEYLVCVWWNQFDCNNAPNFFNVNQKIFESSMSASDIISKGNAAGGQMMGGKGYPGSGSSGNPSIIGYDVLSQGNAQGSAGLSMGLTGSDVLSQGNAAGSTGHGSSHSDGSYPGGDYSAIPGQPGVEYPILSEIPQTSFKCEQQQYPGYYADVEARCQVFHICANNLKYDFLCPNGTIFHQEYLVCVWWNQFDCNNAPNFFNVNQKNFESSMSASDIISKGNAAGGQMMGGNGYPGSGSSGNPSIIGNDVLSQGNTQGSAGLGMGLTGSDVLSQGNAGGSTGHGSSHSDGSYPGGDYSAIPGQPGVDYPILSEIPQTSFKCKEQQFPGYYADVETKCQVFHVCWDKRKFDFLCPNGTIFHQEHFVCVWWNQFDCSTAPNFFALNENIYKSPMKENLGMAILNSEMTGGLPIMGSGVLSQGNQAGSAAMSVGLTGSGDVEQSNESSAMTMGSTGSTVEQSNQSGSSAMTMSSMGSYVNSQSNQAVSSAMTMGSTGSGTAEQTNQSGSSSMTMSSMGSYENSQSSQSGSTAMTAGSTGSETVDQSNQSGSSEMTMGSTGSTTVDQSNESGPSAMTMGSTVDQSNESGSSAMTMGSTGSVAVEQSGSSEMTMGSTGSVAVEQSGSSAMTMGSTGSIAAEQSGSSAMTMGSTGSVAVEQSGSPAMTMGSTGSVAVEQSGSPAMTMGSTGSVAVEQTGSSEMTMGSTGSDAVEQSGSSAMTMGSTGSVAVEQSGSSAMTMGSTGTATVGQSSESGTSSMTMGSTGSATVGQSSASSAMTMSMGGDSQVSHQSTMSSSHGDDGSYSGGDYSAIPGEPGVDYPILSEIPKTSFKCTEQKWPGYYADVETKCQVFHVCSNNRKFDFLCPNGTIFDQEYLVCVWWNQFDCSSAPNFFSMNEKIYSSPMTGSGVLSQGNAAGSMMQTQGIGQGDRGYLPPMTGSNVLSQGINYSMGQSPAFTSGMPNPDRAYLPPSMQTRS